MKNSLIILSQLNSDSKNENYSHQLSLPLASLHKQRKPQISSIPGISPRERNRYRVMLGNQILGDHLAIDEAIELAKRDTSSKPDPIREGGEG